MFRQGGCRTGGVRLRLDESRTGEITPCGQNEKSWSSPARSGEKRTVRGSYQRFGGDHSGITRKVMRFAEPELSLALTGFVCPEAGIHPAGGLTRIQRSSQIPA
jgi:hypothetical protein